MSARRELGRGERVLPGLWRLRLPLPWPGVPHCNAWAIAAGPGVVLIDTGMHEPGSMAQLELAMAQVNLRVEQVRLLACTHAHSDHWGQAAPICERAGCELWLHPNHRHATAHRASGVARLIEPSRPLVDGVEIETDLGTWRVHETPGHAPSHVCLFQPERRLLISGDHVLGRISLYYDYGWTPDPVGEFLHSLDVVDALDPRLGLSGHGRPFMDVHGHIDASRELVRHRLDTVLALLAASPATAVELAPAVHERDRLTEDNASWLVSETRCYLEHLERRGDVSRELEGDAIQWRSAQP